MSGTKHCHHHGKPSKRLEGNRDHVDGVQISLGHLRGSGSIAHLSNLCIGLERNQQGDNPNEMLVSILKIDLMVRLVL